LHILFLSDNFPPEVNAPASRTFEHCREWAKAGHKVTVITCAPNFPQGRVYDGYRNRLYRREAVDGIDVVRVWSYITANEGFAKRTLDYVSYAFTATLASLFVRRADIVIATSPQFFAAVAGYVTGALKRRPFVFEVRDLWPESIKAVGAIREGRILSALEWLELFLYRRARAVVTVTQAHRDNLIARGIDGGKVHVITNGADLTRFKPVPKPQALAGRLGLDGKFVAGYIGTTGMAHALETLLETAKLLKAAPGGADIRIVILGDGARKAALKAMAEEAGLDNVVFLDSVPKEQVPDYWALLDASIIHLKKTELFTTVIPSKTFESMAMGIPILHGVEGESARIVEQEGAGIVFEPENAQALASAILELAGDPQLRARLSANGRAGAKNYERSRLAGRMLAILDALGHSDGGSGYSAVAGRQA
jgi:glycosyltransferase involved in cell wall biosynthesis